MQALTHLPPKSLPTVFKHASPRSVKAVVELVANRHCAKVSPSQIKRLKRYKQYYNSIANCCTKDKKVQHNKARKLLQKNQSGGILPLIPIILAAAGPVIAKAAVGAAVSAGAGALINTLTKKK